MRTEAQLNSNNLKHERLKNNELKYDTLNHDVNIEFAKNSIQLAMAQSSSAVATCKFNPDSCVFLHIVLSAVPDIPVVWVIIAPGAMYLSAHRQTC